MTGAKSGEIAFELLMIVDDGEVARYVADHGVSWLFVDLEHLGKQERQGHLDTWKSRQTVGDVSRIREAAPQARLLVRVNPLHDGSADEIGAVVARGADAVMLPMFRTCDEVARFVDLLAGKAEAIPLVETAGALNAIPQIAREVPLDRVHIGLNDLHLDLGMDFMFQPLTEGLLEEPCRALRDAGVPFGIGGIARAGEGLVPPELILGEHARLGSTAAILSRTFHGGAATRKALETVGFETEVAKVRAVYEDHRISSDEALEQNRLALGQAVAEVAAARRAQKR